MFKKKMWVPLTKVKNYTAFTVVTFIFIINACEIGNKSLLYLTKAVTKSCLNKVRYIFSIEKLWCLLFSSDDELLSASPWLLYCLSRELYCIACEITNVYCIWVFLSSE